jgi:FemAB-related protein (PEP-CTERM system-associated)
VSKPTSLSAEKVDTPVAIFELQDDVRSSWDDYVRGHTEGSFFHLLAWHRTIKKTYGHTSKYLYALRDNEWVGVLPCFVVGGRPFPRALVSVPIGVTGGILASDEEAAELLRCAAYDYAQREGLEYVEYKSEKPLFANLATKSDLYFSFHQTLYGDREKQLKCIPRKTRAVLRSSERARLRGNYNRSDLDPFYDLYTLSLRALGTPAFPKSLFENALNECRSDFVTIREAGRIIGVVMNFYYKDTMLPFFAGTVPEARGVGINNYIYWYMLETGYDLNYRRFDFGRSKKGTGAFKFKKNMGMEPIELEYQYDLVTAKEMPQVNPNNPKYEKVIRAWQKLPLAATKILGPMIQKRLP